MAGPSPPRGIGCLDNLIGLIITGWSIQVFTGLPFVENINFILSALLLGFSRYANGVGVRSLPQWFRYCHMFIGIIMIVVALVPVCVIYFHPYFFMIGWLNLALVAFGCDLFLTGLTFTAFPREYELFSLAIGITSLILAGIVLFLPFLSIVLNIGFFLAGIYTVVTGGYFATSKKQFPRGR